MTIKASAFDLPLSNFINAETREVLARYAGYRKDDTEKSMELYSSLQTAKAEEIPDIHQKLAELFYASRSYQSHIDRYKVTIDTETIAGVGVEIFTPAEGVDEDNNNRVLINVHGGAFIHGSRTLSHLESIPIAALGKVKVVSVDYRLGPDHQFPAANEDVVAVYKALLKQYKPENIGLYGCSAGGVLTAQSMHFFNEEGLPLPAAIGMFCGAAYYWSEGDSGYFSQAIADYTITTLASAPYFKGVPGNDPAAFPGNCPDTLASFPPSLLISSSRDFAMSSVIQTHAQLTQLNVKAELYLWDGLDHAFIYNTELPAARESYDLIINFFDTHLGRSA